MSELKAFRIIQGDTGGYGAPSYKCDTDGNRLEEWCDICEVYDKSEADKVIADLEESHKMEVKQLLIEIKRLENLCASYRHDCDNLAIREANALKEIGRDNRVIRHHKFKRCLDNAWGCQQRMELFHELVLEEARTIALPNEVALKEYRRKRERAAKWHKRWLKIAEQFKEGV